MYPKRKQIRLVGYDYSQDGAYFITVCAHQSQLLFGEIVEDTVRLNPFGVIVAESWKWLGEQ